MKKSSIYILLALLIALPNAAIAKKKITKPSSRAAYHNNMGVKYLSIDNLELAEVEFRTAAELSPDYVEAYSNLGIVAKKRGDLKSAAEYFGKAIELDKNYGAAYSHLSMVYLDQGDIERALATGKQAVKVGPTMPMTHYNLALVYLERNRRTPGKDFSEFAEKEMKIATELDPNMFETHLALARLYKEQGRYELSAIRYRLALEGHPADSKAWTELGEVYRQMGDNPKAENAFRKALDISGGGANAGNPHAALGLEYMGRKEYMKAIDELKLAIAADPKGEAMYYQLGTAYLNIGEIKTSEGKAAEASKDYTEAVAPLKKALELNPQMVDAAYNLGLVYLRLGNRDAAKTYWNQALSLNMDHPRTLYNMGMLLKTEGDTAKANGYFCRFASVAATAYPAERENALNIVKANGGKCQN